MIQKEANYKEKFSYLDHWFPEIIQEIRKDLRNLHLKNDLNFFKKYFPGKVLQKLSVEEITLSYKSALEKEENHEELGEFLTNRWLLQNSEIYYFFEESLKEIDPNFENIQVLEKEAADSLLHQAKNQFGASKTLIFSILNSVAFSKEDIKK